MEDGLKTGTLCLSLGMYYLRTRPAVDAIKFTVDVEQLLKGSCEGFEMKHFNVSVKEAIVEEISDIRVVKEMTELLQNSAQKRKVEAQTGESKACPLRRKKGQEEWEAGR
jgi:hypothetical protein